MPHAEGYLPHPCNAADLHWGGGEEVNWSHEEALKLNLFSFKAEQNIRTI